MSYLSSPADYVQLFDLAPVSLWGEGFSPVNALVDELHMRGIEDFRIFINVRPEFVARCMQDIGGIDVNWQTLGIFGANVCAARTGGDEFAMLLPGAGEHCVQAVIDRIQSILELSNLFYNGHKLRIAVGAATCHSGDRSKPPCTVRTGPCMPRNRATNTRTKLNGACSRKRA